ncbi:hypothetical protein HIM_08021 [Hirsutella minnesotensis 3608]|uniref:NAD(+) kinase n=1 Tax=Hirsutella minnesotensis 3608 TaxID=1043627 RepID=A0A0F7ZYL1_9HYPO|nr:hypothetical protein HIM_08021 [Hirsutella minnesotensis 3608]
MTISSPNAALHPALGGVPACAAPDFADNKCLPPERPQTASGTANSLSLDAANNQHGADELRTLLAAPPALGGSYPPSPSSSSTDPQLGAPQPAIARAPLRRHRPSVHSHDPVARQTLVKALASQARKKKPEALPLDTMLKPQNSVRGGPPGSAASPMRLADALNDLAKRQATPTTALTALQSPCFYHQRFDDAVDIQKVLEEIKNDESMSHSRLVQTATGVREVSKQLQRRPIKRAVRNVMIVTKARDNQLVYLTRELAEWLLRTPRYGSDLGVNVYVDAKLRDSKRFNAASILAEDARFEHMLKYWTPDLCWSQPEKFDLVLTLGGDGTVLFTSWLFQRIVPPVLSFSLGSLGFMTTFEFDKYKQHLNRVMGDEGMKINLRMRFTCTVWRHDARGQQMGEGEQFEVLNELVIDRGPSPYVSNLELYGDDELLTVVQADGCIFSTPTGSTAYSLSAGGSLVHPDIPAILLTPICPHTLSFRPMVLSDTMALRVAVPRNSRATAYCAFDGKGRVELRQGDHVTITASQYPFPTVTRTDTEWFESVSRTLRWNVRAAAQKPFENGPSQEDEDTCWDIDQDSAYYPSEDGSVSASPIRRQMSMLGL